MALAISRTAPFRLLQSRIGSATYRFNTILVGLDLVAAGGDKSRDRAVSWNKPSADKARQVANQAEIFTCISTMSLVFDVFDNYLKDLSALDWAGFSQDCKNVATKAVTRSAAEGGAYSLAERTEALMVDLALTPTPALAAIELFGKWRNITVHSGKREALLEARFRSELLASSEHFHDHYSHLDMALAISNFERKKTPVPKETTSLVAAVQNLSRALDEAVIRRADKGGTDKFADQLMSAYLSESGWSKLSEALQGDVARRRQNILKMLERIGITHTSSPVSNVLNDNYFEELVSLHRTEFASRFGVSPSNK